jgi:hypothetical protein
MISRKGAKPQRKADETWRLCAREVSRILSCAPLSMVKLAATPGRSSSEFASGPNAMESRLDRYRFIVYIVYCELYARLPRSRLDLWFGSSSYRHPLHVLLVCSHRTVGLSMTGGIVLDELDRIQFHHDRQGHPRPSPLPGYIPSVHTLLSLDQTLDSRRTAHAPWLRIQRLQAIRGSTFTAPPSG